MENTSLISGEANEIILTEAGIRPENLDITDICTCCNPDLLFSHRASHGNVVIWQHLLCYKKVKIKRIYLVKFFTLDNFIR